MLTCIKDKFTLTKTLLPQVQKSGYYALVCMTHYFVSKVLDLYPLESLSHRIQMAGSQNRGKTDRRSLGGGRNNITGSEYLLLLCAVTTRLFSKIL